MSAIQPAPANQAGVSEDELGYTQTINDESHGYLAADIGTPLYYNTVGESWDPADADTTTTAGADSRLVVIDSITDVDNYVVRAGGKLTKTAHGFTVGKQLYLSDNGGAGGALTETAPSGAGAIVRPLGVVLDANSILIDIDPGYTAEV